MRLPTSRIPSWVTVEPCLLTRRSSGALNGGFICSYYTKRLSSGATVPNNWVFVCGCSSPASGLGASIEVADERFSNITPRMCFARTAGEMYGRTCAEAGQLGADHPRDAPNNVGLSGSG